MRTLRKILATALAFAPTPAAAQVLWGNIEAGMSADEVRRIYPANGARVRHERASVVVTGAERVGACNSDVEIRHNSSGVTEVVVRSRAFGKEFGILGAMDECGAAAQAVLLQRFGNPHTTQRGMPGTRPNELARGSFDQYVWTSGNVLVTLRRYGPLPHDQWEIFYRPSGRARAATPSTPSNPLSPAATGGRSATPPSSREQAQQMIFAALDGATFPNGRYEGNRASRPCQTLYQVHMQDRVENGERLPARSYNFGINWPGMISVEADGLGISYRAHPVTQGGFNLDGQRRDTFLAAANYLIASCNPEHGNSRPATTAATPAVSASQGAATPEDERGRLWAALKRNLKGSRAVDSDDGRATTFRPTGEPCRSTLHQRRVGGHDLQGRPMSETRDEQVVVQWAALEGARAPVDDSLDTYNVVLEGAEGFGIDIDTRSRATRVADLASRLMRACR